MQAEDGEVLFCVYEANDQDSDAPDAPDVPDESPSKSNGGTTNINDHVCHTINAWMNMHGTTVDWVLSQQAACTVTNMEEDVLINEEEAMEYWRKEHNDSRTAGLEPVASPDGEMVVPSHDAENKLPDGVASPTDVQLQRDPKLLEFDNVTRVDVSKLNTVNWLHPVIITGLLLGTLPTNLTRVDLMERFGEVEVRTGNRYTLIKNGFNNSLPMLLHQAITKNDAAIGEISKIVFSPVKELPASFQHDLQNIIDAFPSEHGAYGKIDRKFTLCLGNEGFGIGWHRHAAACFFLVAGTKKWYMAPQSCENDLPTHPAFYTTKSTHKCLQRPGELLYVPDQWYHEIFNLEFTVGVQALPI